MVTGDEFRLEMSLPHKNKLPLKCKVIYNFDGKGAGIRFSDISRFEQDLLAEIIMQKLEEEGMPLLVDPFLQPFVSQSVERSENVSEKLRDDFKIEEAIAAFDQY